LLHDEYAYTNRRNHDYKKPSPEWERDDHSKQRPNNPRDLKLGLEAAECSAMVGTRRISLH
tara:strand:+ start:428 stop:610 length:183 start_codon:yes stop_codon:yes gene_type:complete